MIQDNKISKKLLELGMKNYYSEASIEVTSRCNAHCDYCYVVEQDAKDLPTEKIYTMLDKLADAGILCLTLTGGEPFLRRDILDIIEYTVTKDFWRMSILTNGTLVTDEHIAFILGHSPYISDIQFSIFSHHPALHDNYTGVTGGYARILKTAEKLKKGGIHIHFALSLLECNVSEFKETHAFFSDLGYDIRTSITKLQKKNAIYNNCHSADHKHCTTYDFYNTLFENAPEKFIECEKNRFSEREEGLAPLEQSLPCSGLQKNICIDSQGNLLPCSSFRNVIIGNIFNTGSLYELVNRSDILHKIKGLRRSDIQPCNTCRYSRSCNICLGLIHTETGRLDRTAPQLCNYAKAVENYHGI